MKQKKDGGFWMEFPDFFFFQKILNYCYKSIFFFIPNFVPCINKILIGILIVNPAIGVMTTTFQFMLDFLLYLQMKIR